MTITRPNQKGCGMAMDAKGRQSLQTTEGASYIGTSIKACEPKAGI